jgi:hypothetical protein
VDPNSRFGGRRAERRKSQRDPMGIPVALHSIAQSRVVTMVDVSTTGARVAGHGLPDVGKDVLLKVAGVELFGTVVRNNEKEAAMRFDQPVRASELEKLRSAIDDQPTEGTIEEQ